LVLKLSFLSSIFFIASVSYSVAQIKNTALTKKDSTKNAFHSSQTPSSIHEVTEMEVGKYQQKSNAVAGLFPCKDCSGKYLEYDFTCKKFYRVKKNGQRNEAHGLWRLRTIYGRATQFRVTNVNRYLYDINLSVDNSEYNSEPSPVFNSLFLGLGGKADGLLGLLNAASIQIPEDSLKNKALGEGEDPLVEFKDQLIQFKREYNRLLEAQLKPYSYCVKFDCECGKESFNNFSDRLTELKFAKKDALSEIDRQLSEFDDSIAKDKKKIEECKANSEKLKSLKVEIEQLQKEPKKNEAVIEKKQTELRGIKLCTEQEVTAIESQISQETESKSSLENLKKGFSELWDPFSKITDAELMKLVLFANNQVTNHLSYLSPTFYPTGNRVPIGIRISPKDSATTLAQMPLENDSLCLDLPTLLKPFISFGAGLFTIWGDQIPNENYGWQAQPDNNGVISTSSKYKLVQSGKSYNPIGFVGNATMGMMVNNFIGVGANIGIGVSIDKTPMPAYMGGVSLLLGARQQFNVSVGWAGISVNELNKELYLSIPTQVYDSPQELKYTTNLRSGTFLSLTYTAYTLGKSKNILSKPSSKRN